MAKHTAFYKNTAWQYGLQIVKYLLPLVTLPYLTRVLEPEGYAIYAYVLAFMSFVRVIVDYGFNLSGTKQIAGAASVEECNRITGKITQARILLSLVSGIVVAVIITQIPILRENWLYTALSFVGVCGLSFAPDFLFQGKEDMGPITTRYLASKGVSTLLTFVLVRSMADILWVPALDILASAIALIWSFIAAKRKFGIRIEWVPWKESAAELRTSGLYCLSNVASTVFTSFTTMLIGVVITDPAQISYWSLSMTVVSAVQALYNPIINSLYPHIVINKDFRFADKIALISLPVVAAGTIAVGLLAEPLMLVMGGEEYLEGSWVIAWMMPVIFLSFYGMLYGWPVIGAMGKVKEITASTVVSAVFCIAALLVVSALGMASLPVICVIRSITELIMTGVRFGIYLRYRGEWV